MKDDGPARCYCFTAWRKPDPDTEQCRYYTYGREMCPDTDREHFQGFIITKKTNGIRAIKRIIRAGDDCHIEHCRGTRRQARDYCWKDGEYVEWGRFESLTQSELFRQPIRLLKEDYPAFYCRYYKGLERLVDKGPKFRKMEVKVLVGKTDTGKTRRVMEMDDVFKLDPPYKWWDGYEGEEILLIDDYESFAIPRGQLLNILDGYRLRLETKGSHTWAKWTKVYITTNFKVKEWADGAVLRRINEIISTDIENT